MEANVLRAEAEYVFANGGDTGMKLEEEFWGFYFRKLSIGKQDGRCLFPCRLECVGRRPPRDPEVDGAHGGVKIALHCYIFITQSGWYSQKGMAKKKAAHRRVAIKFTSRPCTCHVLSLSILNPDSKPTASTLVASNVHTLAEAEHFMVLLWTLVLQNRQFQWPKHTMHWRATAKTKIESAIPVIAKKCTLVNCKHQNRMSGNIHGIKCLTKMKTKEWLANL